MRHINHELPANSLAISMGQQLKALREASHISRSQMAAALNISYENLRRYESGERLLPHSIIMDFYSKWQIRPDYFYLGTPLLHITGQIEDACQGK